MVQPTPNDQDYYGEHTAFDIEQASQGVDIDVAQNPEESNKKKEKTWLRALRTYKTDVSEVLKKKKGSLVNIVLAEKKRKREEERGTHLPRKEIDEAMERVGKEKEVPTVEQPIALQKETAKKPLFYRIFGSKEIPESSKSAPQYPPKSLVEVIQEQIALPSQKIPQNKTFQVHDDTSTDDIPKELFQKNLVVVVSSVLLLFIGIGLSYGAYLLIAKRAGEDKKPLVLSRTLIVVEEQKQIPLALLSEQEIRDVITQEIDTAVLSLNYIEGIYFVKKLLPIKSRSETDFSRTQQRALGIKEIFFIIKNNIPQNLLRAIEDRDFLFGIHSLETNRPFLVITVESFENAFAGMLKWETFILNDLVSLFSLDISSTQFIGRLFEDVVIKNRDARVLKDSEGNIALMYSFIDRETLVITTNEDTFDEVVNRLKTPKKIIR